MTTSISSTPAQSAASSGSPLHGSPDQLHVVGAKVHNLQDVTLTVPRNQLVVFTGVSGSGKSSLAFDTIYAEGQRRYIESMSSYARQFVEQLEKPEVDAIDGLSPTIAIDQKTASRSPRSTVGTITEITDYLRLLYAKIGTPHDPDTGQALTRQNLDSLVDMILGYPPGTKLQLLAPMVRGRKGEYNALFQQLRKEGYSRVQIDGEFHRLDELPDDYRLKKTVTHDIAVVVDRLVMTETPEDHRTRVAQAIETCLKKAEGYLLIDNVSDPEDPKAGLVAQHLSGGSAQFINEEMAPRLFSFNSPYGACSTCDGLGFTYELSTDLLVPDPSKSVAEGALVPFQKLLGRYFKGYLRGLAKTFKIPMNKPYESLSQEQQQFLLYGHRSAPTSEKLAQAYTEDSMDPFWTEEDDALWKDMADSFDGLMPILRQQLLYGTTAQKTYMAQFMEEITCPSCQGKRLKPFSLAVTLGGKSLHDVGELNLYEAWQWVLALPAQLSDRDLKIAREPLAECQQRLQFLLNVGLHYLNLNRRSATLSGGEAQRIRLAAQLGSKLSGVLYVLDEPSIGLHPYNNHKLIETLQQLRDEGNSLIVVEHDEDTIQAADWLVDIGPGAGTHGGQIIASGPPSVLKETPNSVTAAFLTGKRTIPVPFKRRKGHGVDLIVKDAHRNNLKHLDVRFPLGTLIGVCGLSGAGKSSLVFDLLQPALEYHLGQFKTKPKGYDALEGIEHLEKVIHIDQSPLGRSPRSNPATYTGMFDHIRTRFANTDRAKMKGFTNSHFSFNTAQGRCATCKGDGEIKLTMSFLPDARTTCPDCQGRRFNPETLRVHYQGRSIADVLAMPVEEALAFFEDTPALTNPLQLLMDVGLGYMVLGQSSTTLSGGEAQRIKLATEFNKRSTGKTVYLLDEPTVGLHWHDLENLLHILNRLVDAGNTIILIEHNLEVLKSCDHLIDLGPESGDQGGYVVVEGTPEQVVKCKASYTGQFLKLLL